MALFAFTSACNHHTASPYDELLSKPPYKILTDSIEQNSSNADLYYRRGMLLSKNNNYPPALADLRKAWSLSKREPYAIAISNIFLDRKPDSAISFLQQAMKLLPESIPLQINLVQGYANQQKIDEALTICNIILQKHPDHPAVLMMKSDLLEQKNDSVGSIKALEQAYRLAPFNEDLCYNLAFKYAQARDPKALMLCDSLLRYDTAERKGEPYYFEGVYYTNINNIPKALSYFDKSIQFDYTFLDAYMEKGKIFYDKKKYDEAAKTFQLALNVSTTYADAYYWLGKCQEATGQKDEARLNYQRAYGLDRSLTEAKEAADAIGNKQ
ncbi:MAG TPA: tetratricopeptide repeat protein [Chitinophagaceae bacterium]|nr:tetratricopeptide repeat protein [Chitinophagaceae bacterium]